MTALLQLVEIVFDLFGIKISGQTLEVKGHGSDVATIVVEGAWCTSQNRNVALEALQQFCKSANFTAGTVKVLVEP